MTFHEFKTRNQALRYMNKGAEPGQDLKAGKDRWTEMFERVERGEGIVGRNVCRCGDEWIGFVPKDSKLYKLVILEKKELDCQQCQQLIVVLMSKYKLTQTQAKTWLDLIIKQGKENGKPGERKGKG